MPTLYPAAEGSFGPKGYFRITSLTSTCYDSVKLTLNITGEAINQPLTMAYSIDEQGHVLFSVVVIQRALLGHFQRANQRIPAATAAQDTVHLAIK
jgi:hypothetical protein